MLNTLIGRKIDQTQKFLENGKRIPVTVIAVGDNAILQVKTQDSDGYTAVQLGFGTKKKANQASVGHSKKAGFDSVFSFVSEVRLEDASTDSAPVAGEYVAVDSVFKPGDVITISGTSKGKGWAGVVKRHNFRGGPKTHGQSDRHRAPGSIGQGTTPGRVYRGKKMAGRMGSDKVSIENLTVVAVDAETKMMLVAGLVPGNKKSILLITKTGERKNFSELLEEKVKREALEAIEAEKAAKIAEEEAAKAPKVEEAAVETAPEVVADATETVVVAEETVGASTEAVKVEATVSEPEVVKKASDAEASADKEPAADETVTEITEQAAEEIKEEEKVEENK